ncbi:MAG: hypothetical protein EZS28_024490 [Streblomastix strix]|uniref:Uncharacterized protein n=1 Tax=Streblomastix strix TaxID=222440 RepID=A0A5J4VBT1_9EUKA|nr:MAG: hypothetical protein EZS28_024490 [Streblomastix strix]
MTVRVLRRSFGIGRNDAIPNSVSLMKRISKRSCVIVRLMERSYKQLTMTITSSKNEKQIFTLNSVFQKNKPYNEQYNNEYFNDEQVDELDLIEMEKEENMIEDNENQQDQLQINSNDDKTKQTNYFNNNNTNNNSNNLTQSKQIIDDRLSRKQNNRLFELQKLYQSLSEVGEQIAAYDHFAEKVDSELLKWSKMIEYASQQRMDLQKRVEQRIEDAESMVQKMRVIS